MKQRTQTVACATAYQPRSRDEEDKGLCEWLRGQNSVKSTMNTETCMSCTGMQPVSAPLSATGLIVPSLLKRDNDALQRERQEEYAQVLRQQMKEKKQMIQKMNETTACPNSLQLRLQTSPGAPPLKGRATSTCVPTNNSQYNSHYHWPLKQHNQGSQAYQTDVQFQPVAFQPLPPQWSAGHYPYLPCFLPCSYPIMPSASHEFYSPSVVSHNAFWSSLMNSTQASRAQVNSSFNGGEELEAKQRVKGSKEVQVPHQRETMYNPKKKTLASEDSHTILEQQVWKHKEKVSGQRKQREKLIQIMEESDYNPWGRPGGGAPVRNQMGKVVTERGRINQSFDPLSSRLALNLSEEEMKKKQQEEHANDLLQQVNIPVLNLFICMLQVSC